MFFNATHNYHHIGFISYLKKLKVRFNERKMTWKAADDDLN